jgi:hypothetical protein
MRFHVLLFANDQKSWQIADRPGYWNAEESYLRIVTDPAEFRQAIDDRSDAISELFPTDFAEGYRLKDFTRIRSTKFRVTFFGLRS